VEQASLSALGSKRNSRQEAILTSLNVVPHAARQGKHGSTGTAATVIGLIAMATGPHARCFQQNASIAAKTLKYRLNLAVISLSTAAIATEKFDPAGSK